MSTLSKLLQTSALFNSKLTVLQLNQASHLVRLLLNNNSNVRGNTVFNVVRHFQLSTQRHGGHERIFRRRQGQLLYNRSKDICHFYIIGLGFVPGFLLLSFVHIVYGSKCELKEYPKEGEAPPRYWQFERTPTKQFWAKYIVSNDIQYHESWASRFSNWQVKDRWRRIEQRVKHLIGERQDYKAYHYHPITNEWVLKAKQRAAKIQHTYLEKGNTTFD